MIYSNTFGIHDETEIRNYKELIRLYEENAYLKRQIKEYREVIKNYKGYIEYLVKKYKK